MSAPQMNNADAVAVDMQQAQASAQQNAAKQDETKNLTLEFKLRSSERFLFSLVDALKKDYEISFSLFTFFMVIQDLQLFSISWRSNLLLNNIPRYVLSPLMWLAETFTLAIHIVSWAFLAILIGSSAYCGYSMATTGQIKLRFLGQILRYSALLVSTVFLVPIAQTFLIPTGCTDGVVNGYSNVNCNSGNHMAILITAAIGGFFLVAFAFFFSGLFFESAPRAKHGKRSGRFDIWYTIARIVVIIMYQVVPDAVTAQGVNLAFLFVTTALAFKHQNFFNSTLNNVRAGLLVGATCLSAVCLAFSFYVQKSNEWIFLGVGLAVYAVTAVAGFFGNKALTHYYTNKILRQIDHYNALFQNPELDAKIAGEDIKDINKSYLEIICQQANDIAGRFAVKQEIKAFPSPEWVDVAVRFIIHSYMDKDAVILANQMFAIAFRQFPKEKSLYLIYIAYIRSFFSFLNGEEYNLLMILLKRHSLAIDEKCLFYFYQQSISNASNGEEGDDQLNYAAFMEYQSLEKTAKECHVSAITELRDFWQAVRSNEAIPSVAARITKVSDIVTKTDRLYESIIKRFPDARNIIILYSRFLLKVVHDKDKAMVYQNNSDRLEKIDNDHDGEKESQVEGVNAVEKRSEGQSSRTSASKEARLQKQKRDLLAARLSLPVQDFMRRIKFFAFLFVLLLVASVAVCKISLDKTKSSLDGLEVAMVPRRYTWIVYTEIRGLQYAAATGKRKLFSKYYHDLINKDDEWKDKVLPIFSTKVQDTNKKPVLIWNEVSEQHSIEEVNAYEASEKFYQALDAIVYHKTISEDALFEKFAKDDRTAYHTPFRFFFDNVNTVYSLFDDDCTAVAEAFASSVNLEVAIIGILGGLTMLLLLLAGLFLPYTSFDSIYDFKNRIINLFYKIPRSLVLDFITDCEEEIEVISGEDETLGLSTKTSPASDTHRKGKAKTVILEWNYILTWLVIFAAVGVIIGTTLYFVLLTQYVPRTYSFSNKRRTDVTEKIYALGVESYFGDKTTWTDYSAKAAMRDAVNELENLHETVNLNLQPFLADGKNDLFQVLRVGGVCHRYGYYQKYADKYKKLLADEEIINQYQDKTDAEEIKTGNSTKALRRLLRRAGENTSYGNNTCKADLEGESKTECNFCKKYFDNKIGFTWDLLTSSVDSQILRFVAEANLFLDEKGYIYDKSKPEETGFNNPRLRLLEDLAHEFTYSSVEIQRSLLSIVASLDELFTIVMFVMFGIALIFGAFAFWIGFTRKAAQSEADHAQLISLLYAIPIEERKKITELNTFIESGGAILM